MWKTKKLAQALLPSIIFFTLSFTNTANASYYGRHLCAYEGFHCIQVSRGDTWARLFPNERDREIVKRLNRTNIALKYRSWIVVPTNLHHLSNLDLSPFPLNRDTGGKRLIIVDLSKHAFAAYGEQGNLIHWGPVSGGKGYCPDTGSNCNTITGKFKILRKQGEACTSSKYPLPNGGAPMPYCMHFSGGYALHGSTLPGFHASHGCVRLFFEDAKWLNHHFGKIGTRVIVTR